MITSFSRQSTVVFKAMSKQTGVSSMLMLSSSGNLCCPRIAFGSLSWQLLLGGSLTVQRQGISRQKFGQPPNKCFESKKCWADWGDCISLHVPSLDWQIQIKHFKDPLTKLLVRIFIIGQRTACSSFFLAFPSLANFLVPWLLVKAFSSPYSCPRYAKRSCRVSASIFQSIQFLSKIVDFVHSAVLAFAF